MHVLSRELLPRGGVMHDFREWYDYSLSLGTGVSTAIVLVVRWRWRLASPTPGAAVGRSGVAAHARAVAG
jgi:cytochrome b561